MISEGHSVRNHIVFDNGGNTTVKRFTVRNSHLEAPTVTNVVFKCCSFNAWVVIDGFDCQYPHTLLDMRGRAGIPCLRSAIADIGGGLFNARPLIKHATEPPIETPGYASMNCTIRLDVGRTREWWHKWFVRDMWEDGIPPCSLTLTGTHSGGGTKELTAKEIRAYLTD